MEQCLRLKIKEVAVHVGPLLLLPFQRVKESEGKNSRIAQTFRSNTCTGARQMELGNATEDNLRILWTMEQIEECHSNQPIHIESIMPILGFAHHQRYLRKPNTRLREKPYNTFRQDPGLQMPQLLHTCFSDQLFQELMRINGKFTLQF